MKMTEPYTFISPLSPQDCYQRLEKLAKKRHFYFSSGGFILHINIDSIEVSENCFNLFIICDPERFKNYAYVYFKLLGEIHPSEEGAIIRLRLQLSKPFSKFYWGFLVFSLLISVLAGFGAIVHILSSNLGEGLLIGCVVAVATLGYAWRIYQTYTLGKTKILDLVCEALQTEVVIPSIVRHRVSAQRDASSRRSLE